MLRRAFLRRMAAAVVGVGMLGAALASRREEMLVMGREWTKVTTHSIGDSIRSELRSLDEAGA